MKRRIKRAPHDPLDKFHHPHIVLVGQPNCGKSTLFNEVAGYQSISGNFPGATVEFTRSHVHIRGKDYDVIDLPGTYSLTSLEPTDRETEHYLLTECVDVLINVVDASSLGRSLELTLQLMDLGIPMVLCLNMADEAKRKGIQIDTDKLSRELGIPVVETVASRGQGVRELFWKATSLVGSERKARHIRGSRDVERIIALLNRQIKQSLDDNSPYSSHLLATKLLEDDPFFVKQIQKVCPEIFQTVSECKRQLSRSHGKSSDEVISAERHALSLSLFESVATFTTPSLRWRDRLDDLLMHNVWGYVFLALFLVLFFNLVFRVGAIVEAPIQSVFNGITQQVTGWMNPDSLAFTVIAGAIQGIGGGVAIVLPYLFPFLMGIALMEDVGYLPAWLS